MDSTSSPLSLCERVTLALRRNGLSAVTCEKDDQGFRLVGHVSSEEDRAVAYALSRTTIGIEKIVNSIEIVP